MTSKTTVVTSPVLTSRTLENSPRVAYRGHLEVLKDANECAAVQKIETREWCPSRACRRDACQPCSFALKYREANSG